MRASFVALGDNSTVRADSVRRLRWTRRSVLAHIGAVAAMLQGPHCFAQPARRRFSVKDFHAMGDGIALSTDGKQFTSLGETFQITSRSAI